jgi:rhodanese-related sulfurtransferase
MENVINVAGGFDAWKNAGLNVEHESPKSYAIAR